MICEDVTVDLGGAITPATPPLYPELVADLLEKQEHARDVRIALDREPEATIDLVARPLLKWAGGKTQLLDQILPLLPERIEHYFEPFIGGGAVFFALAAERRFKHATISDANAELINAYLMVRDRVEDLIAELQEHQPLAHSKDFYYVVRDKKDLGDRIERATRFIFLNRTCFRGLYRVNRKGQFNVPFGNYGAIDVVREDSLRAASRALGFVQIIESDFEKIARCATSGDAIYFDPPYVPVSATANFLAYTAEGFDYMQHARLAGVYRLCVDRGATAILSNADTAVTHELFKSFDIRTVGASRAINPSKKSRSKTTTTTEILVVGKAT